VRDRLKEAQVQGYEPTNPAESGTYKATSKGKVAQPNKAQGSGDLPASGRSGSRQRRPRMLGLCSHALGVINVLIRGDLLTIAAQRCQHAIRCKLPNGAIGLSSPGVFRPVSQRRLMLRFVGGK